MRLPSLTPFLAVVLGGCSLDATPVAIATTPTPAPTARPALPTAAPGAAIRVNSIGFTPGDAKRATLSAAKPGDDAAAIFTIVRIADEKIVFTSRPGPVVQSAPGDTDEPVRVIDFSALTAPGRYAIDVPGLGRSASFAIGTDIWNTPFAVAARAMYLWRCGTAVELEWNGIKYAHAACHLEDGWLDHAGGGHVRRPSIGGWHDAGDYNKYVVNAGVTVGLILKALEHFPDRASSDRLGIPESGNGTPDLLDEVRWELEWLFTMQLEDGRVYHKVSSPGFRFWGPAERDLDPRYFAPWSTVATANFTATMACAARHFKKYDPAFADRCLRAAQLGWTCLLAHPAQIDADQNAFKTGGYAPKDWSARLWAAAELWTTTGDETLLHAFEHSAADVGFNQGGPGWGDNEDLALSTYLLSRHTPDQRDPALVKRLTASLLKQAGTIVSTAAGNPHERPFGVTRERWFWGTNGNVAGQTFILQVAHLIAPDPRFRQTTLLALGHLFGRNYHGRSYVTGLGANPPLHPHDRRGEPAWPGYLVGGGFPDGRGWVDELRSYEKNEIAINWNGALIYAIAGFVEPEIATLPVSAPASTH